MTTPTIDVRDQRPLGLERTFALCLKGIKHRLLRSFLTLSVIVLAVSFFMYLLGSSIDAHAVDAGVRSESILVRRAAQALELWFGIPSPMVTSHRLANADAFALARLQAVTGLPAERIAAVALLAHDEAVILAWLDDLDAGTRAVLVKKAKGRETLNWLADHANWQTFTHGLGQMRSLQIPLPLTRVQAVIEARVTTAMEVAAITTAWNISGERVREAVTKAAGSDQPARWQQWLAAADPTVLTTMTAILAANGFAHEFPAERVAEVQADVRAMHLREQVAAELNDGEVRAAWKKEFIVNPTLDEKLVRLDDERVVAILGGKYTRRDLAEISSSITHERRLVALDRALAGKVPADHALIGGRQLFLVIISFVVCMVGIANAMLMAITERFREIATMKCLGATDSFILTQFLMEAAMQGVAGGVLGMVIGLLLAVIADGLVYGGHLFTYFPLGGLFVCAGLCILAGLLLATLASIYPSWMASRMAPMDAMRVE